MGLGFCGPFSFADNRPVLQKIAEDARTPEPLKTIAAGMWKNRPYFALEIMDGSQIIGKVVQLKNPNSPAPVLQLENERSLAVSQIVKAYPLLAKKGYRGLGEPYFILSDLRSAQGNRYIQIQKVINTVYLQKKTAAGTSVVPFELIGYLLAGGDFLSDLELSLSDERHTVSQTNLLETLDEKKLPLKITSQTLLSMAGLTPDTSYDLLRPEVEGRALIGLVRRLQLREHAGAAVGQSMNSFREKIEHQLTKENLDPSHRQVFKEVKLELTDHYRNVRKRLELEIRNTCEHKLSLSQFSLFEK